jgi:hypothetical protein
MRFEVKLFRINGSFQGIITGTTVRDVIWDATGTSTPPITQGDPNGLIVMAGRVTIDPTRSTITNGWRLIELRARTVLKNRDQMENRLQFAVWSLLNPAGPVQPLSASNELLAARCTFTTESLRTKGGNMGHQIVGIGQGRDGQRPMIPLAPVDMPYALPVAGYRYGGGNSGELPPGFNQVMLNPNLHVHEPGQELAKGPKALPFVIDPARLGKGQHTLLLRWHQDTGSGSTHFVADELGEALLTFPVTVGVGEAAPSPSPSRTDEGGRKTGRRAIPRDPR